MIKTMKIIAIIGARPQFIKHFSFEKACKGKLDLITIHTGQHYDANMSDVFFDQLKMKKPDYMLYAGSGKHGAQTAKMMVDLEKVVEDEKPKGMVVYGDTNSTLAGALVAAKLQIPIFHIEAGLRSYNKEMPEEINRVLTDHISTCLFAPSQSAIQNLKKEGIVKNVYNVGDIMKDLVSYVKNHNLIRKNKVKEPYYYVTLHRPYNTDHKERLSAVLKSLNSLDLIVLMAIHPRTHRLMKTFHLEQEEYPNIRFMEPQSYFDNLTYLKHATGLITDSGGMQKEAYWLQKKCVTIRKETEWIETLENGNNTLLFGDLTTMQTILKTEITFWDENLYGKGHSSDQIVNHIQNNLV
ncbi:MAG: UDP-GlcNAc3NAcA epimerase [Polaribacter sp.]|jgi:UDP-GlcNAc3NAcA epimerase